VSAITKNTRESKLADLSWPLIRMTDGLVQFVALLPKEPRQAQLVSLAFLLITLYQYK